jgi:ABC-type transporter Mla subunit MlaD
MWVCTWFDRRLMFGQILADREDEVKELVEKLDEFGQITEAKDVEIEQLNEELDTLTNDLKAVRLLSKYRRHC